jgi:hypothetical protein
MFVWLHRSNKANLHFHQMIKERSSWYTFEIFIICIFSRDGIETEDANRSGAAPSAKFRGTEPTRIWRVYSLGSGSAPTAPHPNSRGSGSAPLRSRGSPTKYTVRGRGRGGKEEAEVWWAHRVKWSFHVFSWHYYKQNWWNGTRVTKVWVSGMWVRTQLLVAHRSRATFLIAYR